MTIFQIHSFRNGAESNPFSMYWNDVGKNSKINVTIMITGGRVHSTRQDDFFPRLSGLFQFISLFYVSFLLPKDQPLCQEGP